MHNQIWWTFDILEIVLINIHNLTIGYFIFLFLARDADHVCYKFAFCFRALPQLNNQYFTKTFKLSLALKLALLLQGYGKTAIPHFCTQEISILSSYHLSLLPSNLPIVL